MKKGRILIVDDNKNVLSALRILLGGHFEEVTTISTPNMLMTSLQEKKPDIVLLDMNFSAGINTGNEGIYWLTQVRSVDPDLPVVLFTAYADIELAVRALKEGAFDFIVKPWDNSKLISTLQAALQLRLSRKEVKRLRERQKTLSSALNPDEDIWWGGSAVMRDLLSVIEKVAVTDANVLITGENGTGKEVIARRIHHLSKRSTEPLVTVDMGAVSETLFESELFGHTKGAFTDAKSDRAGKFEAADGGTLFLDEIGNLGFPLQSKLLSALQTRQIIRVGSNTPIPVDIRLISATNHNLDLRVAEGVFREDLLYRINTIHIEVPPLRDRREDIPGLTSFFLSKYSHKYGKPGLGIADTATDKLSSYNWPGNIRELQHAVEKAVILSEGAMLEASDFLFRSSDEGRAAIEAMSLDDMERAFIAKALHANAGNVSLTAQQLGITRPTLYNKMKKYGL